MEVLLKRWTAFVPIALTALLALVVLVHACRAQQASSLLGHIGTRDWREASVAFDTRVRSRFPGGTPSRELAAVLREEGFEMATASTSGGGEAVLRRDGFVCRVAARIFWRLDAAERVSDIHGVYREEGCL